MFFDNINKSRRALLLILACAALFTTTPSSLSLSPRLADQGRQALTARSYPLAVRIFTEAIKKDPHDAGAYFYRCIAYAELDDCQKSIADFEKGSAISTTPDAQACLKVAGCYLNCQQNDKAIAAMDKSIKLCPSNMSYRLRGQMLWKLKRPEAALADLDQAIKLSPKDFWALDDRASFYATLGRYGEAIQDSTKLIELRPTDARGYARRAKLYEKLGKKAAAEADRKKANQLGSDEWF